MSNRPFPVKYSMPLHRPGAQALPKPPPVGATLAALRQARALSLDELSRRAGVSKSMLSQIERAQANPTVAVVWRLANALGVAISELLGGPPESTPPVVVVVPAHATPALRNSDGLCELRILGPIELAGQFEWYGLSVKPGGALVSQPHEPGSHEHLTVLSGTLEVRAGPSHSRLKAGETARYAVDQSHAIHNPARGTATALLVVVHPA